MLKYYKYSIPFKSKFKIAKQSFDQRTGLILEFTDGENKAISEIAPLPGFSKRNLKDIIPILRINREVLNQAILNNDFEHIANILSQVHRIPELDFGLDSLHKSYQASKGNLTLSQFLFAKTQADISVNAVIGIQSESEILKNCTSLIQQGYNTLKLKVGLNFEKEYKTILSLRKEFSNIKIRLDSNQSWTFDEAVINLLKLNDLNIEYCEEPLKKEEVFRLKELRELSKIPLAADESVGNKETANELIRNKSVDILIIKPMLFGSISDINVTMRQALSHDIDVVFTTALESIVGRTLTAIIASGLGTQKYAHGLSTGSLFEYDLYDKNEVTSGSYKLKNPADFHYNLNYNLLEEII